ncbi:MAG: DUF5701 family protein [Gaiellaceae bacterium]
MARTELRKAFDRQVETLLAKGYAELAGIAPDLFRQGLAPLRERLSELPSSTDGARLPFVIAVHRDAVRAGRSMPLVELAGRPGLVRMDPTDPGEFAPIEGVHLPLGPAYLLADLDTGADTLNVTPDGALERLLEEGRSPLTIEEGVAVLTHYPDVLETHNSFSLLGSRRGDRRVPALWRSNGHPRLGWCWAGNPHTWLGSASCAARLGS